MKSVRSSKSSSSSNRINLPCVRWKKESITKLIKRNNGFFQRESLDTFVSTANKTQRIIDRPLQHIIPLELKDTQQSNKIIKFIDNDNSESATRSDEQQTVMLTYMSTLSGVSK